MKGFYVEMAIYVEMCYCYSISRHSEKYRRAGRLLHDVHEYGSFYSI